MKTAIISDIHGNLEALTLTLTDIAIRNYKIDLNILKGKKAGKKIDRIVCLGDVIGYGPNPIECLEIVRENCDFVLAGNHELAAIGKHDMPTMSLKKFHGMSGLGAVQGIHWFLRQCYGDNTPIQEDPVETREYTKALLERMLEDRQITENEASDLIAKMHPNSSIQLTKSQRWKGVVDVPQEVYRNFLVSSRNDEKCREFYKQPEQREKGLAIIEYLKSLPVEVREGETWYVHDNPFEPGSREAKYVLDIQQNPEYAGKQNVYSYDELFKEWPKQWPKVYKMFIAHTHLQNKKTKKGRTVCNGGSVGIPRGITDPEELESKYAIYDDEKKGSSAVTLCSVPMIYWEKTGQKMEDSGLPNKLSLEMQKANKGLD